MCCAVSEVPIYFVSPQLRAMIPFSRCSLTLYLLYLESLPEGAESRTLVLSMSPTPASSATYGTMGGLLRLSSMST